MDAAILLLLLLGAYFSLTALAPAPGGSAWAGWPFAAAGRSAFAELDPLAGALAPPLAVVAGAAFLAAVLGSVGLWVPAAWWAPLVLLGACASLLLHSLYIGRWSLLPIAVDLALLWGVLALGWSASRLAGAGA
jgi:hypothetical protein